MGRGKIDGLCSSQIVYSEHHYDECFEYKKGGRVSEGEAIGYMAKQLNPQDKDVLVLFEDIKYSAHDEFRDQLWIIVTVVQVHTLLRASRLVDPELD